MTGPRSSPGPAADQAAAVPPECAAGHHLAGARVTTDATGVQHARCRRCGCDLTRLPTLRRWYRSGWLGGS
jgi:hypothetical protein